MSWLAISVITVLVLSIIAAVGSLGVLVWMIIDKARSSRS